MLDDAILDSLETTSTELSLYFRHAHITSAGKSDPFRVTSGAGRWGTHWTLHTASAIHVALSEYCRNFADDVRRADPTGGFGLTSSNLTALARLELQEPVSRRAIYRLSYQFERLADITTLASRRALRAAGFQSADLFADDFGACPALAFAGERLGWDALRAPSAAWRHGDGFCIAVFPRGHKQLRRTVLLEAVARPTIAVAYATAYRRGKRPEWLGPDPRASAPPP